MPLLFRLPMNNQENVEADLGGTSTDDTNYEPYQPKILVPITTPEQLEMLTQKGKVWHWMKKEPLIPIGTSNRSNLYQTDIFA